MYEEKTLAVVNQRLETSELFTYMREFQKRLYVYPESVFDLKPKQQNQLKKTADELWPEHLRFEGVIQDYKNSIVLQGTHQNVVYLINEAAQFTNLLEKFNKSVQKAKQNQHLYKYYQDTFKHKPKDVLPLLLNDLFYLSKTYNLDLQKEELIERYKESLKE